MKISKIVAGLALLSAIFSVPARADVTLTATGSGWCSTGGDCNNTDLNSINNTYASDIDGYRNWFAFSMPILGQNATGATINIWNEAYNYPYSSPNTFTLYSAGAFNFDHLIDGPALGTTDVLDADTGVGHYVSISLNFTAISLINAAQGNYIVFAGYANWGQIFGYTGGYPIATLTLTGATVPAPGALALLGFGLLGLGKLRRKAKAA